MNSLIKYGLYFVVAFSVLAFGGAEVGKTAAYAPAVLAHCRGRKLRRAKEVGGRLATDPHRHTQTFYFADSAE